MLRHCARSASVSIFMTHGSLVIQMSSTCTISSRAGIIGDQVDLNLMPFRVNDT